jgi:hypothetical protein
MVQHPSPLPGSSARTDTLTFIPTLEEKKSEKKSKKEKDESENAGLRKPSWGWFKGSDEKEKKEKKKEEDHKESKKGKVKATLEKAHDNARLDVLQSTMDTGAVRGRESLLLDRDSLDNRLQDARGKESTRKSGGENKKEKDGLFSSFFGGGKKKTDRESGGKKGSSLRTLSPDPPHRQLKPDVDYNWTRFSILEERAIYRMAHIKLANPRRALYSQVLLSNFMYSYLAKVQQMHPQIQVPQSALQKKQEAERRQKELEQQQREEQQQRQEVGEQYRYDYHQVSFYQSSFNNANISIRALRNTLKNRSKTQNPKELPMWMILRYTTMIIRMMTLPMDRVPIAHNPVPLSTMPRMAMWIRTNSIVDKGATTISTHIQTGTIMRKTTTMICGDCNVVEHLAKSLPCYLCIYDGVVALVTSGWSNIRGLGCLVSGSEGSSIIWKHSVRGLNFRVGITVF